MAQVDLEVLQAGGPDQRDREAHDLDVGGEVALAQQLGAHLQDLARAAAALGLLAVDRARVAEAKRPVGRAERGGGDAGEAGGEVVAEREDSAVAVGEADQPLGDARPAGPEEGVLVLERRGDQLLVRRALEHRHRRALELAAAAGGLAGEVERPGRSDGELRGKHGAGR